MSKMTRSAKLALLGIVGLALSLVSSLATADDTIVLVGDEVTYDDRADQDLLAFGGKIDLQGEAESDVLALGGSIDVDMNVDGDLVVMGGDISVAGVANQDALVIGGNIAVGLVTSDDFDAVGGNIIITADSTVGGHASLYGGYVELDGVYAGPVEAGGGEVDLIGQFAGDVEVAAGDVMLSGYFSGDVEVTAGNIKFGDNVQFLGDLTVLSPDMVELPEGIMIGGEFTYEQIDARDIKDYTDPVKILWIGLVVAAVVSFFVFGFGAVIIAIAEGPARRGVAMIRDESLKSFLYGLAVLVLGVIAIIIASVIYEPLAIASILYVILILTGYVFGGYAAITLMIDKGHKPHGFGRRFGYSLLGLLLLIIVGIIPLLGGLIGFVAMIFGVGAFFGGLVGRDKIATE